MAKKVLFYSIMKNAWSDPAVIAVTTLQSGYGARAYGRLVERGTQTSVRKRELIGRFDTREAAECALPALRDIYANEHEVTMQANKRHREELEVIRNKYDAQREEVVAALGTVAVDDDMARLAARRKERGLV